MGPETQISQCIDPGVDRAVAPLVANGDMALEDSALQHCVFPPLGKSRVWYLPQWLDVTESLGPCPVPKAAPGAASIGEGSQGSLSDAQSLEKSS